LDDPLLIGSVSRLVDGDGVAFGAATDDFQDILWSTDGDELVSTPVLRQSSGGGEEEQG
jgi:hypothetical protein